MTNARKLSITPTRVQVKTNGFDQNLFPPQQWEAPIDSPHRVTPSITTIAMAKVEIMPTETIVDMGKVIRVVMDPIRLLEDHRLLQTI